MTKLHRTKLKNVMLELIDIQKDMNRNKKEQTEILNLIVAIDELLG